MMSRSCPSSARRSLSQGEIVGSLVDFGSPVTRRQPEAASIQSSPAKSRSDGMPGLAGTSVAWRDAVASVRGAVAAGGPILVSGEMGVGKSTLLLRALAEMDEAASVEVVEAASARWVDVSEAMTELDDVLARDPDVGDAASP